ncbi:hypothetical protein K443DRAFT_459011 [Laccaria amethystina LaAM-08-1]|uniref:Uncharacterized protein n=1 Tax=Laccaria amethystina LaAM-08-1 TaxID=1095629 RepID=A0A0C9WUE8_9AGAR|nr:hypothetical protein K443DRAFT_459011 [Laccaria amethystina LaAM-08-1]
MFMRYIPTTSQGLEARSVAVVVEFSQRSNHFKLLDTDGTPCSPTQNFNQPSSQSLTSFFLVLTALLLAYTLPVPSLFDHSPQT